MDGAARGTLRVRLTIAAGAALVVLAAVWSLNLGAGQCGNADSVECSTLGYGLLYGWIALALVTAGLVAAAAVTWLSHGWRRARQHGER